MRAKTFITEGASGKTLYHVTLTKNVSKIQHKGILPLQTSNWVQAGNNERYGGGYIFSFEHIVDAARWAAKWDWEVSQKLGSGKISIVSFTDDPSLWEEDDADPLSHAGARGQWLKKQGHVRPTQITGVFPASIEFIKQAIHENIDSSKSVLLEYSRQITAQNLGEKLLAAAKRDPSVSMNDNPGDNESTTDRLNWLMAGLEEIDPTPHKEYVQWLCKIYAGGQVKLEDLESRGKDALTRFQQLKIKKKLKPEHRDINRFKLFNQFETVVASYPEVEEQVIDKGDAKEIYSDSELRIVQPIDEAAAKYYGQGTRWCTAAKSNNMFDRYNRMGQLYILLPTHPAHPGEKYQFHFESNQYMDELDHEISFVTWPILRGRFPQLVQIFGHKANLNLCIPLMPNRERLIKGWEPMMDEICSSIAMNFPTANIMHKVRAGLRGAMVSGEQATERVLRALRNQLDEDEYGLVDIFAANINHNTISDRDALFDEIMMDPISDWIQDGVTGEVISELADDSDGQRPRIDDMGAYMEIVDSIFGVIFSKIKNAICDYAKAL